MARASAGIVYSSGAMAVLSPCSAAVEAVTGPMHATSTPCMSRGSSPAANSAAKCRTVEELVKVTTSTLPASRAAVSAAAPSTAGRVR